MKGSLCMTVWRPVLVSTVILVGTDSTRNPVKPSWGHNWAKVFSLSNCFLILKAWENCQTPNLLTQHDAHTVPVPPRHSVTLSVCDPPTSDRHRKGPVATGRTLSQSLTFNPIRFYSLIRASVSGMQNCVCVSVNKRKVRGHSSVSHVDLLKTGEINVELVWIIRTMFENILFQGHFGSEFSTFHIFSTLFFQKTS